MRRLVWSICTAAALVLLGGCADSGAFVSVSGPNVQINRQPAPSGRPLAPGDLVTTGPDSTATISFNDGTTIELAPGTDPTFDWNAMVNGSKRVIQMNIENGATLIQTGTDSIVRWIDQWNSGSIFSRAAIVVWPAGSSAYLFEGHMIVETPPPPRAILPMQVFTSGATVQPGVRTISPAEAARVQAMFPVILAPPPPARPPPAPPWSFSPPPPPPWTPPDHPKIPNAYDKQCESYRLRGATRAYEQCLAKLRAQHDGVRVN
jgi:hypothetical protein